MVQQTSPRIVQSVSAWQSCSPWLAGSQTFCALDTRLVITHAWPCAESQLVSVEQNCGQLDADWQTLPPTP
jgi:hypothetical protein